MVKMPKNYEIQGQPWFNQKRFLKTIQKSRLTAAFLFTCNQHNLPYHFNSFPLTLNHLELAKQLNLFLRVSHSTPMKSFSHFDLRVFESLNYNMDKDSSANSFKIQRHKKIPEEIFRDKYYF